MSLILSLLVTFMLCPSSAKAADGVEYQRADSIEVVTLVRDTSLHSTLDYARHFVGRPYVAHTLDGAYKTGEKGAVEHLVVNLRQFDCLTLVETCRALVMTRTEFETNGNLHIWDAYCRNLARLRYFRKSGLHEGKARGSYLDRIHYLTMSIDEHREQGLMTEVALPARLTREHSPRLNFMSRHPQSYFALKSDPTLVKSIAQLEHKYSGKSMRFLPQANCGLSLKELGAIQDGDIVYIVTSKDGLDYAHQGFAFWDKDASTGSGHGARLHMLHASSAKKRVIADPLPLDAYLNGIKTSIGVRVFRSL